MLIRFGIFLGWLFNAAALLCAGLGAVIVINQKGPLSDGQTYAVTAFFVVAGAIWLLGRGIRYVFVGPKRISVAEFVERFADPTAPIRLPKTNTQSSPRTTSVPITPVGQDRALGVL